MRTLAFFAAGLAALALPVAASAAPPATTATYANVATGSSIDPFGPTPATPTYGQVFVSPRSGTLDSFSFTLLGGVGQIHAGVGTWTGGYNNSGGGGSPTTLWESALVMSGPGVVTFTPNVHILDLTKYVAYITVYNSPDAMGSTSLALGDNSNSALRYFTFDNGTGNPSGNIAWDNGVIDYGDALFSFSVTTVPEPAEWALMIAGFGLAGAVARRRRSGLALAV